MVCQINWKVFQGVEVELEKKNISHTTFILQHISGNRCKIISFREAYSTNSSGKGGIINSETFCKILFF